jgi:DNA-binding MarR family transcriptional regulator
MKQRLKDMHVGRLIQILSHSMRRHNPTEVIENDDLTTMQKHVLKFILLETMHRDLYQKDVEEEFQVRKPTATGILKLMEKNGYIYRESARQDANGLSLPKRQRTSARQFLRASRKMKRQWFGESRKKMWSCANRFCGRCMKIAEAYVIVWQIRRKRDSHRKLMMFMVKKNIVNIKSNER